MNLNSIIFSVFCVFISIASLAQSSNAIEGVWLVESQDAHIKIFKSGNEYVGEIIWMRDPIDSETGKPQLDKNNHEPALKTRKVMGMRLMKGLTYDDGEWVDGSIYDANNGKTYSCKVTSINENTIELTGYVGFTWLGRTDSWTRVR